MITKEYLPANEQALRAREQLKGEAELELEETPDSRYDDPDGINRLLSDLEQSFGERELFRQGGVIREFESVSRLQGESVTQFVRRFRLLERKLQDNRVPEYPEEARVIKLLDGLRLDERSTSALLLAAGNRYNMKLIQEAIRIQYPPGMSVTGIPKHSAGGGNNKRRVNQRWSALNTHWEDDWEAEAGWDWDEFGGDDFDWTDWYHDMGEDYTSYPTAGDDVVYEYDDSYTGSTDVPPSIDPSVSASVETTASGAAGSDEVVPQLMQAVNALTVTSQRLAQITQSRGFYHSKGDGKSKGKGKSGGKGKGSSSGGKSSGKHKGHGKKGGKSKGGLGKSGGKGKPGMTPTRANFEHQQQRLQDATCLGCGSSDHWIKDCPKMNRYSAQLATAASGMMLDPNGDPNACSWMTTFQPHDEVFVLPPMVQDSEEIQVKKFGDLPREENHQRGDLHDEYGSIPPNPRVLLQYADKEAHLMIADTGCQRQVAGRLWHEQRQREILPLTPSKSGERCSFSFGPNKGVPSRERMQYPAGLGGVFVALGVSVVDSNAPALFSRPSFASLGAVPNIVQGVMHYQALKTESKLYLSPCGHLAIRVDEWPSFPFQWPIRNGEDSSPIEDACTNDEVMLEPVPLVQTSIPSRPPPHASLSSSLSSSATMVAPLETGDATCVGVRPHDSLGSDLLCLDSSASPSQGQCVDAVLSSSDGNYHADVNLGRPVAVHGSDNQVPQRTWSLQTSFWPTFLRRSRSDHSHLRSVRVPLDAGIGKRSGFDTCNTKGPSNSQDSVVSKRVGSGKDCVGQDGKGTSFKPKLRKLSTGFKWLFPTLFAANWTSQSRTEDIHDIVATQSESTVSIPRCPYSLNSHATLGSGGGRIDGHGGRESDLGSGDRNLAGGSSGLVPSSRRFSRRPFESEPGGGRGTGLGELNGVSLGTFSADRPMLKEDVGSFKLKCGTQKRLLGNIKQLKSLWNAEAKVYENRCRSAQQLRGYKHDIAEVFAGMANITAEALARGLNAIQPIDMVHGVKLESKEDFSVLTRLLAERRPFLVVWEIRCDPWSNIQHLNYTQEELEKIRQAQYVSIKGMCDAIQFLKEKFNVHFLLENPWGTPFPEIQKIMQLQDAKLSRGSMCNFELRGKDGMLIKKDTGWLTDLDEIGSKLALPCPGNHQHEVCMGGNSKRAQIYTRQLAKAVVSGLVQALQDRGDERLLRQETSAKFSWVCGSEFDEVVNMDMSAWLATRSPMPWKIHTLSMMFSIWTSIEMKRAGDLYYKKLRLDWKARSPTQPSSRQAQLSFHKFRIWCHG